MFLINLLNSVNISAVVTVAAAEERVLHYYRMVHGIMIMKSKFLHALWSFLPFSSSSSKQRHRSSTPIHIPNNTTINTPISTPANFRWVMMISIEWRYSLLYLAILFKHSACWTQSNNNNYFIRSRCTRLFSWTGPTRIPTSWTL